MSVRRHIVAQNLFSKQWIVGGGAVRLMPEYFNDLSNVTVGEDIKGVLQIFNPMATRTTIGCPQNCEFCGVDKIEGEYRELRDYPNLPIICDSNLTASSMEHFERVIVRLISIGWCDFNQGLDVRLMTQDHAKLIAMIKNPIIRIALDSDKLKDKWTEALEMLLSAGIAKYKIGSYVLIGFNSQPIDDWRRCEYVENKGIKALPMWFHSLDAMEHNVITEHQKELGWTERKRKHIMGWYYKHRGEKPIFVTND
ncbi:hypothetical protein LCGC14_1618150 [marine sediment metagenome]|uniref:Radical SAM core domain-containing protein n=1 Tax=marine sediment metagenome TaxID=412755 RepID=A0A0F9KLW1_9ZZZZ